MKFTLRAINGGEPLLNDVNGSRLIEMFSDKETKYCSYMFRVCQEEFSVLDGFLGGKIDVRPTSQKNIPSNRHLKIVLPTKEEISRYACHIRINGHKVEVYRELLTALINLRMGRYITVEAIENPTY